MKKKIQIVLVLLISSFGFSQNTDSEDSCTGDVKYYTIFKTYIYKGMNTNSAIVAEVPAGEQVLVFSTFFGDHGWWKICYKGTNGYAEKIQFSDTKKPSDLTITKEFSIDNPEVGFSPFLARTTTTLNFRSGPSTSNSKIKSIWIGSTIFIYSEKTVDNYYKSIDVTTGKIGWIHKNYVKHFQDVVINEENVFESAGYTGSQYPEVLVTNRSSQTAILVIGTEIISLSPNSTKSVKVRSGRKYFIIITPGIIPLVGYQMFETNTEYKLEF